MNRLDSEETGTGYDRVDTQIACVITRFRVRSIGALWRFYRSYRRVRAHSRRVSGLLTTRFLIEDWHTCYTLSLWRDDDAILEFNGSVLAHIDAANRCFRDLEFGPHGPQLWSAQFRLWAVSQANLRWDGVDLPSAARTRRSTLAPVRTAETEVAVHV